MYASNGRPSIAPERLIRALLLQVLYSVRSERLLVEQLDYNLLFRWFVGLSADEAVWDASTFSKNRERFTGAEVGRRLLTEVVRIAKSKGLTSNEHFSVDGTLIAAWASQKSVRRKDGNDDDYPDGVGRNAGRNFQGEKRSNETHQSRTDPDALLARKGNTHPARPSYAGHLLMENRNGLIVAAELTPATGTAEREAALELTEVLKDGATVGADKGYDVAAFVTELRERRITPHVAQNTSNRRSAIDGRTTRHPGYEISQRIRKRIEEPFGWAKTIGNIRQVMYRGTDRVREVFLVTMAAYNLVRLKTLLAT
jgi:transposase